MKLRLTGPAARQLDQVLAYIEQHNPQGARNVQQRIQVMMHLLLRHPQMGHTISRFGVRRVVISPYPYALTYRVGDGEIVIRTIRHTSRRPLA